MGCRDVSRIFFQAKACRVSGTHRRGEVDHHATFAELEEQATNMTTAGYMGQRSPDRLDAMVWALSELSQGSEGVTVIGSFGGNYY